MLSGPALIVRVLLSSTICTLCVSASCRMDLTWVSHFRSAPQCLPCVLPCLFLPFEWPGILPYSRRNGPWSVPLSICEFQLDPDSALLGWPPCTPPHYTHVLYYIFCIRFGVWDHSAGLFFNADLHLEFPSFIFCTTKTNKPLHTRSQHFPLP